MTCPAPYTWFGWSTSSCGSAACAILLFSLLSSCGAASTPAASSAGQDADPVRITVSAGAVDRLFTPVVFDLQDGPRRAGLLDASGRSIPLQIDPDGRYWFILDSLMQGESRSYTIVENGPAPDLPSAAAVERRETSLTFSTGGNPFFSYQTAPGALTVAKVDPVFHRGGYIHPLYSPEGVQLTDDYPPDHLHHHGIWAAWTRTQFQGRTPDFWNMGDRTGTVVPVALYSVWNGAVFSGLRARHAYVDLSAPSPTKAIDEDWMIRVFPALHPGIRMFDLIIKQVTATDDALHLPEYRYGGVGFRGHRQWNGEENTFFLSSEGKDRSDGHATRARWCHIGGYVDGRLAGVAVLDHPENFRSPQPMRIHPSEPFFNYAPSQLGDWSITPGDVYTVRYRFITYDGPPDADVIDRLWNDFASPPAVSVEHD